MSKFKVGDKVTPVYEEDQPSGTHPWLVFKEVYTVTQVYGIDWIDIEGTFTTSACP